MILRRGLGGWWVGIPIGARGRHGDLSEMTVTVGMRDTWLMVAMCSGVWGCGGMGWDGMNAVKSPGEVGVNHCRRSSLEVASWACVDPESRWLKRLECLAHLEMKSKLKPNSHPPKLEKKTDLKLCIRP